MFDIDSKSEFWEHVADSFRSKYPWIDVNLVDRRADDGTGLEGSIYFTVPVLNSDLTPDRINENWEVIDVPNDALLISQTYRGQYDSFDDIPGEVNPGDLFAIRDLTPYTYVGNKVFVHPEGYMEHTFSKFF